MRTDAVFESADRVIVAELKYYAQPFSAHYGAQRLHSAHLYQIGTYLDHYASSHALNGRDLCGLLLYAGPPTLPAQSYDIRGRRLHVRSLRLDRPWRDIHDELLGLLPAL
jgi:5-methylcytosine-specific restriction enzyme subunit McrC